METYNIRIMEKYEAEIEIEAETEEQALEIANNRYENGNYSKDTDLVDSDIELI